MCPWVQLGTMPNWLPPNTPPPPPRLTPPPRLCMKARQVSASVTFFWNPEGSHHMLIGTYRLRTFYLLCSCDCSNPDCRRDGTWMMNDEWWMMHLQSMARFSRWASSSSSILRWQKHQWSLQSMRNQSRETFNEPWVIKHEASSIKYQYRCFSGARLCMKAISPYQSLWDQIRCFTFWWRDKAPTICYALAIAVIQRFGKCQMDANDPMNA